MTAFVDEELRSYEHPGIAFRPGPTGRRAALADGPDVWEVIASLQAIREANEQVEVLVEVSGLTSAQVGAAMRYYAAYPDEIDERIALNREAADREEQLWAAQNKRPL